MRKRVQCRRSITRTASRVGVEVERLEQRFAMAVDCGCGAAVDPTVAPTEPEPAALVVPPEVAAARSQGVQFAQAIDTRRLPVPTSGAVSAVRRGWFNSPVARSLSQNEPRQATGLWSAGAYVGGRTFRYPVALVRPDFPGPPSLPVNQNRVTDGIRFRVGLDGEGRPNRITDLRIQFLATLHKADGTREGRVIYFSDAALTGPVRDEFDFAPSLTLQPRGGTQTFEFNWRDSGGFNDHLFFVELKLTWNNRTKTFTASMKAESDEIEGQSLVARTYPGGQRGVVLASGPRRDPIYVDGVLRGYRSGAMRRTGA
ncbi:MAG: hypothetical protein ACKOES_14240 [Planctomycetaceae bacterium]